MAPSIFPKILLNLLDLPVFNTLELQLLIRNPLVNGNGKIEIFHKTINNECLKSTSLIDLDDARNQIAAFIKKYNTQRLYSSLFYLTPKDFLMGSVDVKLNQRNVKLQQAKLLR